MVLRSRRVIAGALGLFALCAASPRIVAEFGRDRTISLFNIHTKETLTIQYMKDGKHIPTALEKVSWALRDWRKDEATKMDPALVDLIWEIHAELGSREPVHIISGYRSRATNEMLRASVGGQASESRHILGKAADVHFPDIPLKLLRYSALIRERGGVGYYPTSAIPFVHVDTDQVRHWPRLPKYELALLFPQGQTRHVAADGTSITKEDVRVAQGKFRELAVQVAEYHDLRKQAQGAATLVADAGGARHRQAAGTQVAALAPVVQSQPVPPQPAAPKLAAEPKLIERPSRFTPRPSDEDRSKLAQMVALAAMPQLVAPPQLAQRRKPAAIESLAGPGLPPTGLLASSEKPEREPARVAAVDARLTEPSAANRLTDGSRFGWGNGWAAAPAYDEEHPEELSYRPFPLAPLLTASASLNDPIFSRLVHHDVAKTLDLVDQASSVPPLKLRPGQQAAQLMWAQQFKGEAVSATALDEISGGSGGLTSRKVKTSAR